MLVLSRKAGQKLVIDDKITIVVNRITGNRVSLGIEAPEEIHVMRGELKRIRQELAGGEDGPAAVLFEAGPDEITNTTPK